MAQMESKGAAVFLAFMAGVSIGLVEHSGTFAFTVLWRKRHGIGGSPKPTCQPRLT